MKYETVFWDFDGVWSKDRFYKSLVKLHPKAHEFIESCIFGSNNEGRVDKWMRAELTMDDINRLISQETGIDFVLLTVTFLADVSQMEIEMRHIPIVEALKQNGVRVGMITNNMDVFDKVTRPRLNLDGLFNGAVTNSFTHGKLKAEGLFDIAMKQVGQSNYTTALLIDDSSRARAAFEAKGGQTYAYTTFEDFQIWANQHLLK